MKRTMLILLAVAAAGSIAILHAEEDALTPHCDVVVETTDGEDGCCCGGETDGCTEDCASCTECSCETDCTGCDETDCTCDDCGCESTCGDCTPEDATGGEEEVPETTHCGGCH